MIDHTVTRQAWAVVLTEPRAWAVLNPGDVLSTRAEVEVLYDTREDEMASYLEGGGTLWEPGVAVAVGDLLTHDGDGDLYEVIQAHTTQADWEPQDVPALFRRLYQPEPGQDYAVWVQPTGAHDAYQTGDRVLYPDADGGVYESTIDANVWSPDAYPAGWTLIP